MPLRNTYLTDDIGSIFIQPDGVGPNDLRWLGCHDLGDVDEPVGDVSRTFCPDPTTRGRWLVATRTQGPPGEITFDVEMAVGTLADSLEIAKRKGCAVPVYVIDNPCTPRDQFNPFARVMAIEDALITNVTRSGFAIRNSDGGEQSQAMKTFSFSAKDIFDAFTLDTVRRTNAEAGALLDIAICNGIVCAGVCGGSVDECTNLFVVAEAVAAAIANAYYSNDAGVTWTVAAALPFAASEDISSNVCFDLDDGTTRWLVARGTTDGANPAEVAYSDNSGTAWTLVAVGATNAEFSPWNGGLFALDGRHIWCATDTGAGAAGEIYFSSDFGATWTAQGAAASDALNGVKFATDRLGIAYGDTNEILLTTDGGAHWVVGTGPGAQAAVNIKAAVIFSALRFYVGYDDGTIWMTDDGGTSWTQCIMPGISGHVWSGINDLCAIDEHVIWGSGYTNVGADEWGVAFRTISGGEQWEYWQTAVACDTGVGLNAIACCSVNHAFAVGCPETTAIILEVVEF